MSTLSAAIFSGTVWWGPESSWLHSVSWCFRPSTSTQSSWERPRTRTGGSSEKASPTSFRPSNISPLYVTCIVKLHQTYRQSLSLIMVTMMAGISQFVIHILLPSTDNVTRSETYFKTIDILCWTQDPYLNIHWPVRTCPRDSGNSLNELSEINVSFTFLLETLLGYQIYFY